MFGEIRSLASKSQALNVVCPDTPYIVQALACIDAESSTSKRIEATAYLKGHISRGQQSVLQAETYDLSVILATHAIKTITTMTSWTWAYSSPSRFKSMEEVHKVWNMMGSLDEYRLLARDHYGERSYAFCELLPAFRFTTEQWRGVFFDTIMECYDASVRVTQGQYRAEDTGLYLFNEKGSMREDSKAIVDTARRSLVDLFCGDYSPDRLRRAMSLSRVRSEAIRRHHQGNVSSR